jgi:hypothetical protein
MIIKTPETLIDVAKPTRMPAMNAPVDDTFLFELSQRQGWQAIP